MPRSPRPSGPLTSPFLLGFEDIEALLERARSLSNEGYPPYNIERLYPTEDGAPEVLRITLAVAGFSRDDLEIVTDDRQLLIRGKTPPDEAPRTYLHKGIAMRGFQRTFMLASGIEVIGADLTDGLLRVDCARRTAEEAVKRIEVKRDG